MTQKTRRIIAIGLCTYRRPQVTETLASLGAQIVPEGSEAAIFVVDNDDAPSAEAAVRAFAETSLIPVSYQHCPAHNISLARNAVLVAAKAARAEFLAFLDDDETAPADWVSALLQSADSSGAEVILGPVSASYLSSAPDWMRQGKLHDTNPTVGSDGSIRTGYTCNALIRLDAPSVAGQTFDLERGRSGGEDTAYFAAIHAAGGRIAYAEDARLHEVVPEGRASFGWMARRRFRMGQTHGSLIGQGASQIRRLRLVALAFAKALACGGMAVLRLPSPGHRNAAILRGFLHIGTVSALLGVRSLTIYGAPVGQTAKLRRQS